MYRALATLRKGKQYLLGVENKRQILYFFKKLTQRLTRKSAGETNGEVKSLWLMGAPTHAGWQF